MTTRMLDNWAKRSANAAARRKSGSAELERKKRKQQALERKRLAQRKQVVKVRRGQCHQNSNNSELQAFLKRVNISNKHKLGKSGKLKRVNRHPDPRNKQDRQEARERYNKLLEQNVEGSNAPSQTRSRQQATPTAILTGKEAPESNFYVKRKEGSKTNEWAMLGIYQAEKSGVDATSKERKRRVEAQKVEAYLKRQEQSKYVEMKKEQEDKAYWLKYERAQKKNWLKEQKLVKQNNLEKHRVIQVERNKQLEHQKRRLQAERARRHKEEMQIVNRQKREVEREKLEKMKVIKQKEKELEVIKNENALIQIQREKQKQEMWAEEARIDAQWTEILDKQERAREKRLQDLYDRQHKLVAIGQQTQNNVAADLAKEAARIKRHQDAQIRRENEKALQKEQMAKQRKIEMMKSIDGAVARKRQEEETQRRKDLEFGIKMNKIAKEKLDAQDAKFSLRLKAKEDYRRDLVRQIAGDNARKAEARAAMDVIERQINTSLIRTVKDKFERENRWMKMPKSNANIKLSQIPL
eukprot:g3695.t1